MIHRTRHVIIILFVILLFNIIFVAGDICTTPSTGLCTMGQNNKGGENCTCAGYDDTDSCNTDYCSSDDKRYEGSPRYVCCNTHCVYEGVCYNVGDRILNSNFFECLKNPDGSPKEDTFPNKFCEYRENWGGGEWKRQFGELEQCEHHYECEGYVCAEDPDPPEGTNVPKKRCCKTGCLYQGYCWQETDDPGAIGYWSKYCKGNQATSWPPQFGTCKDYIPENDACMQEYNIGWGLQKSGPCNHNYECSEGKCVIDAKDPNKQFCCATNCVYDDVCYKEEGIRVGSEYYCKSGKWDNLLDDLSNCISDFQCKSNKCIKAHNEAFKKCSSDYRCVYNDQLMASGHSYEISGKKFCNQYLWHDCQTTQDCDSPQWCDSDFICKDPVCQNKICEIDWGGLSECHSTCNDCTNKECIGDQFCNILRGENCQNAIEDCSCNAGDLCFPGDRRANEMGCVRPTCGDETCDIVAGECDSECEDCNLATCQKDPSCNVVKGENCFNSPDQCECLSGWRCEPTNPISIENGCYNPTCGNKVCDKDQGECSAGCTDCTLHDCLSDSLCSFFNSTHRESCLNSIDCICSGLEFCDPLNSKANKNGCYFALCGDGDCDGNETCETCGKDCGICNEVKPTALAPVLIPEKEETSIITVYNYHTQKELPVKVTSDILIGMKIDPKTFKISQGTKEKQEVTISFLSTMEDDIGKQFGKIYFTHAESNEAIAQVPVTIDISSVERIEIAGNRQQIPVKSKTQTIAPFDFEIINTGNEDLFIELEVRGEMAPYVTLDLESFSLIRGNSQMIKGEFDVKREIDIGVYENQIKIIYGSQSLNLPLILSVFEKLPYCGDNQCQSDSTNETCNTCPKDCHCIPSIKMIMPFSELHTVLYKEEIFKVLIENTGGIDLQGAIMKITGIPANILGQQQKIPADETITFTVMIPAFQESQDLTATIEVITNENAEESVTFPVKVNNPQYAINQLEKDQTAMVALIKEYIIKVIEMRNKDVVTENLDLSSSVEKLDSDINEIKTIIEEAKASLKTNDYATAETKISEAKSAYNVFKEEFRIVEEKVIDTEEKATKLRTIIYVLAFISLCLIAPFLFIIVMLTRRKKRTISPVK